MTLRNATSARPKRRRAARAARAFRWPTDPATTYARDVDAGRIVAGPHVRAACARHLQDLQHGPERGLRWDVAAVDYVIGFFRDVLCLAGGEFEGKPFIVVPWQAFILGSIFGWKGADDFRRFQVVYCETGKGSGKSPLAGGIGLFMMMADGESRAEVYAAAVKKDQAMVLFRDAVAMVDQSPALSTRIEPSGTPGNVWNLAYLATHSFFRPISTENRGHGQSGPRPHCGLLDEIHEHKTNAMVELMRAGFKFRKQPLLFMITNSGVDRQSVCFEYHTYGVEVASGQREDDRFFSYICALDDGDDPFEDRGCWPKANPSLGVTIQEPYLEDQVRQAKGMPGKESIVRRLNFCQWVDAFNPWIPWELWHACEVDAEKEEWDGPGDRPCFAALDLSARGDLTARALAWPDDELIRAELHFWSPEELLLEHENTDHVPYLAWAAKDQLEAVPGRSIDYAFVAAHLARLQARCNLVGVAFDPWRIEDLLRELDDAGVPAWIYEGPDERPGRGLMLVRHGQGFTGGASPATLWMPRSVSQTEEVVLQQRLRVKRNPVLTWNSASAVLVQDPAGNQKWEKRRSKGRIDGIVALSMAIGLATADLGAKRKKKSVYDERGISTI